MRRGRTEAGSSQCCDSPGLSLWLFSGQVSFGGGCIWTILPQAADVTTVTGNYQPELLTRPGGGGGLLTKSSADGIPTPESASSTWNCTVPPARHKSWDSCLTTPTEHHLCLLWLARDSVFDLLALNTTFLHNRTHRYKFKYFFLDRQWIFIYLPFSHLSPVQYKDLTISVICLVQTNMAKMELLMPHSHLNSLVITHYCHRVIILPFTQNWCLVSIWTTHVEVGHSDLLEILK